MRCVCETYSRRAKGTGDVEDWRTGRIRGIQEEGTTCGGRARQVGQEERKEDKGIRGLVSGNGALARGKEETIRNL